MCFLWSLKQSRDLVSVQLESASKEALEILTSHEIIAINQDPVVGASISPFRWGINVSKYALAYVYLSIQNYFSPTT